MLSYLSRGPGTCSYDTRRDIKLGVGNMKTKMISRPDRQPWEVEVEVDGRRRGNCEVRCARREGERDTSAGKAVHMQLLARCSLQTNS
jgi:hypothetical protein